MTRLAFALRVWLTADPALPGVGAASCQISTAPPDGTVWRPTKVSAWSRLGLVGSGFQVTAVTVTVVELRLTRATSRSAPVGRLKAIEPALLEAEPKVLTAPPSRVTVDGGGGGGGGADWGVALSSFERGPLPTLFTAATW